MTALVKTVWPVMAGVAVMSAWSEAAEPREVPKGVWVRPGYRLTVAEATIKQPRFLKLAPDGTLYVSVPNQESIMACRDKDGDGYYETVTTFLKAGSFVHGLFWHEGWLWYTRPGTIGRARDADGDGKADENVVVLPEERLTQGGGHWWRSILIHKGRLYTSIGDPGNATPEDVPRRMKILSYALDGSDEKVFCTGIRNTEKLVVRPGSDEIWGMDHGSDRWGKELEDREDQGQPFTDLIPPEEMNHYVEGGFYGHPFVVGPRIPRLEFLDKPDITALAARSIPPEWCGGAHWAANAMEFYTADQFPGHKGDAFVCYHGSWNRTQPGGYCVTRVLFEDGHPYGELPYVKFLPPGAKVALGRPVDACMAPEGSLLISDDGGNRIYRLSYAGK